MQTQAQTAAATNGLDLRTVARCMIGTAKFESPETTNTHRIAPGVAPTLCAAICRAHAEAARWALAQPGPVLVFEDDAAPLEGYSDILPPLPAPADIVWLGRHYTGKGTQVDANYERPVAGGTTWGCHAILLLTEAGKQQWLKAASRERATDEDATRFECKASHLMLRVPMFCQHPHKGGRHALNHLTFLDSDRKPCLPLRSFTGRTSDPLTGRWQWVPGYHGVFNLDGTFLEVRERDGLVTPGWWLRAGNGVRFGLHGQWEAAADLDGESLRMVVVKNPSAVESHTASRDQRPEAELVSQLRERASLALVNSPIAGISGWMEPAEMIWLRESARTRPRILEIGSWCGKSSWALAIGLPEGGVLTCLDTWRGSDTERLHDVAKTADDPIWKSFFTNHQLNIALGKIRVLRAKSEDGLADLAARGEQFDMIFVDADHTYVGALADILGSQKVLAPGGLLCGHDYGWGGNIGFVKQAVDEVGGRPVGANSIWAL